MTYFASHYSDLRFPVERGDDIPEPGFREAQRGALFAIASHFTSRTDPAIVTMPTGSGKTTTLSLLQRLRAEGMDLIGPLPADTAFLPAKLAGFDTVLAMYHDQGLPVLKYSGFEQAVNLTLGLPYPRVAVDHGTALDLAGRGVADPSSLQAATTLCAQLARQRTLSA